MTDEQGLGQSSRVLIHLEKQPRTTITWTFLNQPAVKSDIKQSLPKCWVKGFYQRALESVQPLLRRKLPNKYNTKKNRNRNQQVLLQKSFGGHGHEIQHPFQERQLLIAPNKQEAESSHRTLSGCCMLLVLSEKPRGGLQICVWWCVCPGGV